MNYMISIDEELSKHSHLLHSGTNGGLLCVVFL